MTLAAFGFPVLKLFPAEPAGGVRWLNAVIEPLPDIRFCPAGGVNGDNAASYLACGTCWRSSALGSRRGGHRRRRFRRPSPRAPASRRRCVTDARVVPKRPSNAVRARLSTWSSARHRGCGRRLRGRRYWRDGQRGFWKF